MTISLVFASLWFIVFGGSAGAQSAISPPAQSQSPLGIQHSKVRSAVGHIRDHVCPACPTLEEANGFYEFPTYDDGELEGVKLNIKKQIAVAGIEFDVPVTIYLKNNLPEKILVSDRRNPRPARKSPIGLVSARKIPITPDGKIAKLKYPDRLAEMFRDKSTYSIAQFFWDSEDGQIGPTDFRTEKQVTVCGVTFETDELLHYEWSDGYWGGPFKKPFKFEGRTLDPKDYMLSFFYKDGCHVRMTDRKTGALTIK